jgi:hypothetical protein
MQPAAHGGPSPEILTLLQACFRCCSYLSIDGKEVRVMKIKTKVKAGGVVLTGAE